MSYFLNLLLVVIVTTGSYAQQQQPYGQACPLELRVQYNLQDSTFELLIFDNPAITIEEIVNIRGYEGAIRDAQSLTPPKDRNIHIAISEFHFVFIKTDFGITSVNFYSGLDVDLPHLAVMLVNGKLVKVLNPKTAYVEEDFTGEGEDVNFFRDTEWQWNPMYDKWAERQLEKGTRYIDVVKEKLTSNL